MERSPHNDSPASATFRHESPLTKGSRRVIAGVCSGIAERLDMDAVVVRVTAIVLLLCTCGLVAIPYIALAVVLPAPEVEQDPVDVDPLSITSDRYSTIASVPEGKSRSATNEYAVRADAGHRPPEPPEGSVPADRRGVYAPTSHAPADPEQGSDRVRTVVVCVLAVALTALFAAAANHVVKSLPGASLFDFWPLFLVVAGTVALVCLTEELSLAVRLCGLILCIEACLALLPFTLGICPLSSLDRLGDLSIILWFAVALCLLAAVIFRRRDLLALAVGILAVTLVVTFVEIGVAERYWALSSYMHHNATSSFFRG